MYQPMASITMLRNVRSVLPMPRQRDQRKKSTGVQNCKHARPGNNHQSATEESDVEGDGEPGAQARLVVEHDEEGREQDAQQPRQHDVQRRQALELLDGEAKLEDNQALNNDQTQRQPDVRTQTVHHTSCVRVPLAERREGEQGNEDEPHVIEAVADGDLQHMQQEKRVEIDGKLANHHHQRAHKAGRGREELPAVLGPGEGHQHVDVALDLGHALARRGGRRGLGLHVLVQPVVIATVQKLDKKVADDDAQKIRAQKVEEERVPPAFLELGNNKLERELCQLEEAAGDHDEFHVTEEAHLAHPAKEVRDHPWAGELAMQRWP
eukprot:m.225814 g.225814  ORF g.225814 m.225814 type:complete len:323 (+) comp11323_c0_seq1:1719-2687(+)